MPWFLRFEKQVEQFRWFTSSFVFFFFGSFLKHIFIRGLGAKGKTVPGLVHIIQPEVLGRWGWMGSFPLLCRRESAY